MLLVLLLGILIYPATTFGWLSVKSTKNESFEQNQDVLPASTSNPKLSETEKELYIKAMEDINQLIETNQTTDSSDSETN
jgi:hypothetical protein